MKHNAHCAPGRVGAVVIEALERRVLLAVTYTLTDLGTLGGVGAVANAINDDGLVVGFSNNAQGFAQAFRWTNGTMSNLTSGLPNSSEAKGISELGHVVGVYNGLAARFSVNGVATMGTFGGATSAATDVNRFGTAVGWARTAGGAARAFVTSDGVLRDSANLGTLGGLNSWAFAINDNGRVVGASNTALGRTHAFLVRNGAMIDLGAVGGTGSSAADINASDQITGYVEYDSGQRHLVIWGSNLSATVVGRLSTNGPRTEGLAINDDGWVVGYGELSANEPRAFVYDGAQMRDLNGLVVNKGAWVLQMAMDINNSGQIVGLGIVAGSSEQRAFLLTPAGEDGPPTGTLYPRRVKEPGGTRYRFGVEWRDDRDIDVTTLGNRDVGVIFPSGNSTFARLVNYSRPAQGLVSAVYRITPPGGSWDISDNGTYTVIVRRNAVADVDGNFVAGGALGTFGVKISSSLGPTAVPAALAGAAYPLPSWPPPLRSPLAEDLTAAVESLWAVPTAEFDGGGWL